MRSLRTAMAVASVAALVLLLAPAVAEEDVRGLLQALGIDIPARPLMAPPFSLPDLRGVSVSLSDYRGRPVMLYFWTTY